MKREQQVVHYDPEIRGGVLVFVRTRVPVQTLLDYLGDGDSLDVFLDHYPSVSREQAIGVLKLAAPLGPEDPSYEGQAR